MKSVYLLLFTLFSITTFSQSYFQKKSETAPINAKAVVTPIVATIAYQGYDETEAYFGEGEYEIFLDNLDGILDKPIIILDGFDPGDNSNITDLYDSLNFNSQNIADILRDEGFDIVILNAPQYTTNGKDIDGGADYIQRNAMVLIELINFLNDQKVGDEELVVLGPSMGGLIARYALAYMEQNSLDAETRLFLSFDSPHRGANIPISLQYLINYLAEELGNADAQAIIATVLNSPAAKEMLYDHYLGHLMNGSTYLQDPTKLLPVGAPNFRDAFQTELDALGFPQQVRNVSMVNGSSQGTTTGTPGMQVVDTTLDFGSGATADVILHFTPEAGQTNTVTDFNSFLFGIPVDSFQTNAESFANSDGVDASPGGTSNISNALGAAGGNPVITDFINALNQDEFSFVPVISSLAISNEDDWFTAPDIGGIHTSPFVNTYIPAENETHGVVTQASAQFALDEIRNGVLGTITFEANTKYQLAKNPVENTISLLLDPTYSHSNLEISVFTITGQQVLSRTYAAPSQQVDIVQSLRSGMYLLLINDSKKAHSMKFIVK